MNVPKIRFETFTEEWRKTSVGQVAHIIGGGTPSTSNIHYWGGDIQWFTPSEVGHCKYVNKSERTISELGLNESSAKLLPANSILLSSRATIGEMSINTCECATNQGFQSLVPYNADLEFLFYIMHTKKNDLIRESNGSTFLEISANKVRSLGLVVPKRNEQEKIGLFLKNLDSSIETLSKKITSLKQTKQACLQQMFPQPGETTPRIRFKGFEGEWQVKKIGEISERTKGKGYSKSDLREDGTPIVLYGRLYTKYSFVIDGVDTYAIPTQGAVFSTGNEVVIPASGETAEDIAIAAAIKQKGVILGGDLNILTFANEFDPSFMALCITNSGTHYELSRFAQGKSVVHLRNNDIANGHVVCPALAEQQQIAAFFLNMDKQIRIQEQRLEKLKRIKTACLENMFV